MGWIDAVILGLVQGLTEFLPVSSSGHLVLAQHYLGMKTEHGVLLEVLLHLGSVASIVTVFHREVLALLKAVPRTLAGAGLPGRASDPESRTIYWLLVSAIPAGLVGVFLGDQIETAFSSIRLVACLLLLTGINLLATRLAKGGERGIDGRTVLFMALAQAVAILPGISRSGSTIAAGIWAGSERAQVGRFAFLMGILPILGAGVLEFRKADASAFDDLGPILLGVLVSFASGVVALRLLLHFVARGRLSVFAPWVLGVGIFALIRSSF